MSKILNTKNLLIALGVLVVVYFLTTMRGDKERSFKSELFQVDTSAVSKMVITPMTGKGEDIILERASEGWQLKSGDKSYKPNQYAGRQILGEVTKMRASRLAANDQSKWEQFQVTESTGTRVKLYDGNNVVADFYVGKFNYEQPQNPQYQQSGAKMSTCIRPTDEDKVYVVDGFVKMSIPESIDGYRSKKLSALKKDDIRKVELNYPDGGYALLKNGASWSLNGQPTDSTKVSDYISKLSHITGSTFIDDVKAVSSTPAYSIKIEGDNFNPVEIKAFPADSVNQYIITSSELPSTQFSGSKGALYERIFPPISELIIEEIPR